VAADVQPTTLKRRALPVAVGLALISLAGLLTDTVATSQVLALAGPSALSIVYPLSGIFLGIAALVQFSSIDRRPRLTMLKVIGLGYAAAFAIALTLLLAGVAPTALTIVVWLLGDQVSLLLPVVLWSLAADVFNTGEGNKVFGWVMAWSYGGQIIGLAIATVTPNLLTGLGIPLVALLVFDPLACLVIGLWIPFAMRGSAASRGHLRGESVSASLRSAKDFFRDVPVWRSLLITVTVSATAGTTALLAYSMSSEDVIGSDAEQLQMFFGATSLAVLLLSGVFQLVASERFSRRIGIGGQLLLLPIVTVVGGMILAVGDAASSLLWLAVGITIIGIPTWTVDENARHSALTVVPDQVRARISLVLDLGRHSVAQIASGVLALIGIVLGALWLIGIIAAVVALASLFWGVKVVRDWDASMLNWRLRRRKHGAWDVLSWNDEGSI
jgi:AAA family ATP:ADP antiporter